MQDNPTKAGYSTDALEVAGIFLNAFYDGRRYFRMLHAAISSRCHKQDAVSIWNQRSAFLSQKMENGIRNNLGALMSQMYYTYSFLDLNMHFQN